MDNSNTPPLEQLLQKAFEAAQGDANGESDALWELIHEIQGYATPQTFESAAAWCESADPVVRRLGTNILAQLGGIARPFVNPTEPILDRLLDDVDPCVVGAALVAMGHLRCGATARILPLATHASAEVRSSVVHALMFRNEDQAIQALIALSHDDEETIRDWATFGLAQDEDADSAELRQALIDRIDDESDDVREEAILGLAIRRDPRAVAAIEKELQQEELYPLVAEAAAAMPSATYLESLTRHLATNTDSRDEIELAIARCEHARDGIIIRTATLDDAEAMLQIYAPYVRDTAISFEFNPPDVDEFRERMRRALEEWTWLALEVDGAIAGYAYGGSYRVRAAYRGSVETSIYLAAGYSGRGLGKILYVELLRALTHLGYASAFAGSTSPNPASEALHRAVGFEPIGIFPRAGYKFEQWHDVAWWYYPLSDKPPF